MAHEELWVRKKAEGLKSSRLVLEQWIFFPASREERDLHMVEKNIQALASGPGTVSYLFVFLVFSESNVLDGLKKDLQMEYVTFYNLFLHAPCKGQITN